MSMASAPAVDAPRPYVYECSEAMRAHVEESARRLPIGNFAVGLPLEVMRVDQRLPVWLVHNFASADECQHIVKTFESMLRATTVSKFLSVFFTIIRWE